MTQRRLGRERPHGFVRRVNKIKTPFPPNIWVCQGVSGYDGNRAASAFSSGKRFWRQRRRQHGVDGADNQSGDQSADDTGLDRIRH